MEKSKNPVYPVKKSSLRAFTIIEILAVMMIVSLAVMLVVVQVYRRLDSTALRNAGEDLLRITRYARFWAAQYHQTTTLHLDRQNHSYWLTIQQSPDLSNPDKPADPAPPLPSGDSALPAHIYLPSGFLPEKVRFGLVRVDGRKDLPAPQAAVVFRPDGTADAALIQIRTADETHTLLIHPYTAKAELKALPVDSLAGNTIDLDHPSFDPLPNLP